MLHPLAPLALFFVSFFATRQNGARPGQIEFARLELERAVAETPKEPKVKFNISVDPALGAECYNVADESGTLQIRGGDASGAMYGALEAAERIKNGDAFEASGKPFLQNRGLNLFLTLPWDYDKNTADQDPAALADPARWWFHDDHYWQTLLDEMARARLNWLDLHGAYDLDSTRFPNFYAYFIQSEQFPEVGVAKEIKAKNLARLNQIIDWAHERGVKVSFMSYEAQFWIPQKGKVPYEANEANLYKYTKEVVEKAIRNIPKLDSIGFRIGESGHGGEFFKCYEEAVAASGRDIPLYTRSWVTTKNKVVPLARASNDFTVEIKYNGEQWGPPYHVAGGRVPLWYSYSFEDYFSDSRFVPGGEAKKMWPGVAINNNDKNNRWPDQPYKIVWQVRANGTHRIFPFYNPQWIRRTIGCMQLGTTSGYTVEPMNAYYPASPRYYLKDPTNYPYKWIHERDWMYLMCWGRLGYDNNVKEEVFDKECQRFLKNVNNVYIKSWKKLSLVVPIAFTSFAFGPDHRDHAPELEWGGDTRTFIETEPFDEHSIVSSREHIAIQHSGGIDGRMPQYEAAQGILYLVNPAVLPTGRNVTFDREGLAHEDVPSLFKEVFPLVPLGKYYSTRVFAAYESMQKEVDPTFRKTNPNVALTEALKNWRFLTELDLYKPFTDRLRMGTHSFQWDSALLNLEKLVPENQLTSGFDSPYEEEFHLGTPSKVELTLAITKDNRITATVWRSWIDRWRIGIRKVWILVKPLPSSTFFHRIEAKNIDQGVFETTFPYESTGHLVAAEVEVNGKIYRIPNWLKETPYKVVPPKPEPTPQIYSFQEALSHLDPAVLDSNKYGTLLIGPRAWAFHKHFDNRQRAKILDAVERGMDLLILQQDWTSGRYPLDWLPDPPKAENYSSKVFDPDGALGLSKIETDEILYQHFVKSPNWTIHGDGGVASRTYGKGNIYIVAARLMQRMHIPDCAKAILTLLKHGRVAGMNDTKPVVVIDSCSEGPRYSNSFFQDMMNAHGIPFLTLGEVIAREQGMDSYKIIPGPIDPNHLLEGKGAEMISKFYEKQFREAAAKPIPATKELFEAERARRKSELYKSLGLDPAPEKAPLNAKIVSTVKRDGYRMENILFESRPGFPVTGHLYIPDNLKDQKAPAIVSVNGHWQHKTHESVEQLRNISSALHGYVVFAIDSPGHSFEGDAKIERRNAGTHDDYRLIVGSQNTTAVYVWDCLRAVDYLETRSEVDMNKLGITGVSGGGLTTLFAFAADDRYKCAVPVCYVTSFEMSPPIGCLCNHVPGFLQIGDRDSVLAIQAPKPVFVIGASNDYEFPPDGTNRTGEKLQKAYDLFGAKDKVKYKIYQSGHDYNKEMRQDAMGFFDLHLRGMGNGAAVAEPNIQIMDPTGDEMFCIDPSKPARTMHDLATERLMNVKNPSLKAADIVALNGGARSKDKPNIKMLSDRKSDNISIQYSTLEAAPGLKIPMIIKTSADPAVGVMILFSDKGKNDPNLIEREKELLDLGLTVIRIDPPGIGELAGFDPRIFAYMGIAPAFEMAEAIATLADLETGPVGLLGEGQASALAAIYTTFLAKKIHFVAGLGGIRNIQETLSTKTSWLAVQPRADHAGTIEQLQKLTNVPGVFSYTNDPDPPELPPAIKKAFNIK